MSVEADTEEGSLWPPGIEPTTDFLLTLDFVRNTRGNLFVTGRATIGKLRGALERGGLELLDDDGERGPGLRLRRSEKRMRGP